MADVPDRLRDPVLGAEVARCRPKTQRRLHADIGQTPMYYTGVPLALIVAVPLTGIMSMAFRSLGMRGTVWQEPVFGPLLAAGYVALAAGLVWFMYWFPDRDTLVLYEHGIRFRLGFRRATLPFDEIEAVELGFRLGGLERAALAINRFTHPGLAEMTDASRAWALTFRLRRGPPLGARGILVRFVPEDIAVVMAELSRRFPLRSATPAS